MAAPLLRTTTAPVFQHSLDGVARLHSTMSMTSAPRTSQLSGSTAYNPSLESLGSSATIMVPTNGQVIATSNIINQKADASRSLYQICVALKQRLGQVPGFEGYMQELEQRSMDPSAGPVEALWGLLRTGRPLLAIYNALQPARPLSVAHEEQQGVAEEKIAKIAIMRFVGGTELNLPTSVRFIIADLTGHDTTGFVKVCRSLPPPPSAIFHDVLTRPFLGHVCYQLRTRPSRISRPLEPSSALSRR